MTRDEILARYHGLRDLSRRHHTDAFGFLSKGAMLWWAKRIGLAQGTTILADNDAEMTLIADLAVYGSKDGRSRAVDRLRKAAGLSPLSDEGRVLDAMCAPRFSVFKIAERHPVAGVVLDDLFRNDRLWLVDEGFERTMPDAFVLATRVYRPCEFWMTAGVAVPVSRGMMEAVFERRRRWQQDDSLAFLDDAGFAEAVYGEAIRAGAMAQMRFDEGGGEA